MGRSLPGKTAPSQKKILKRMEIFGVHATQYVGLHALQIFVQVLFTAIGQSLLGKTAPSQ